jgi:hypothetical protein
VQKYIEWRNAFPVRATALAVEIYCAYSMDPFIAFHMMREHWKQFQTLKLSTMDGVLDTPNRSALLRLETTIKAVVHTDDGNECLAEYMTN